MSFVGDIFGGIAAKKMGKYNQALYNQQAKLAVRNAEIKQKTYEQVDKPRILAAQERNRSNQFVALINSGVDVDRIGGSPYLTMLAQGVEDAFETSIGDYNSTVTYQNELNSASLLRAKGAGEAFKGEMAFRTGVIKGIAGASSNYNKSGGTSLLG
mgnify:FL=1|tara:strand:+ start:2450 stop:2917 length:468 start_codon:yes stop_codon:yes gene_type:complete